MRGWREGVDKETGHEIMKTPSAVTPCAFTPDSLIKGSRQDGGFGPEGGGQMLYLLSDVLRVYSA